jgi:hypothetical protein
MAARISGVGRVTVSERRSMISGKELKTFHDEKLWSFRGWRRVFPGLKIATWGTHFRAWLISGR